ncbi:MAG: IPT/TIG domain-containing protein, partial [Candidatus Acidiferrales bacterium]
TVNNPVPTAMSLSPEPVAPGSSAQTLSVAGTNFNSSSVVDVNGAPRPTTFVSSTMLTAALPASDFVNTGVSNIILNITVNNPQPGGGTASPALAITVPDFIVTPPATPAMVAAGQPANFALGVAPSSSNAGLGGAVMFSASGLPPNAGASFNPSPLPAGSKSQTVTLTITTMAHTTMLAPLFPGKQWPIPLAALGIAFVMSLVWLARQAGRLPTRQCVPQFLAVLLLAIACTLAACGGSSSGPSAQVNPATGTPAGTYPITVVAASGNASLSTTVTLTVQ